MPLNTICILVFNERSKGPFSRNMKLERKLSVEIEVDSLKSRGFSQPTSPFNALSCEK